MINLWDKYTVKEAEGVGNGGLGVDLDGVLFIEYDISNF